MALEDLTGSNKFIDAFNVAWPTDGDFVDEGDDHVRGIKNVLHNSFPNVAGAVILSHEEINNLPALVPPGTVLDFAGAAVPAGFLGCAGQAVSRATYAKLFAAIGVLWGAGDGVTTFNVPNLLRRTTIGAGGSAIVDPQPTVGSTNSYLSETHTLSWNEMPAHTHSAASGNGFLSTIPNGSLSGPGTQDYGIETTTNQAGGSFAHNNMQPSAVVNKIIKT